jgi:hypothetical protein
MRATPAPVRALGKGVNFYSLEKETAIGEQMAQEVERHAKTRLFE